MFKIIIISIHFQNKISFSNNMLMFIFIFILYDKRKFEIDINNDDYFGYHIGTYEGERMGKGY
jgi:hypothetical protein